MLPQLFLSIALLATTIDEAEPARPDHPCLVTVDGARQMPLEAKSVDFHVRNACVAPLRFSISVFSHDALPEAPVSVELPGWYLFHEDVSQSRAFSKKARTWRLPPGDSVRVTWDLIKRDASPRLEPGEYLVVARVLDDEFQLLEIRPFIQLTFVSRTEGERTAYSLDTCLKLVKIVPGCIAVPCDYRVAHTGGRVDFWFGYIEPPAKDWRVLWSAGMVERLLRRRNGREIVWTNQEELAGRTVTIGHVKESGAELLVLDDGWIQYSVSAATAESADLLRRMALAYRWPPLPDCDLPENESEEEWLSEP